MVALVIATVAVAVVPAVGRDAQRPGNTGKEYSVRGMVLRVDVAARTLVVSHEKIAGLMDGMVMPFEVRDAKELDGVMPGAIVDFALVVGEKAGYATRIVVKRYESVEQDPRTARRLATIRKMAGTLPPPVALGAPVPDFTLVDQSAERLTFSSLAGKVVAVNFVYTRCALPQFCLRVTNNFGVLQKRFQKELSRGELALVTITFDPERDTPAVLAAYASRWNADGKSWRFLTGPVADVRKVTAHFGVDAFPDEGLMNHSLRTAIIDRRGRLIANIEGNQYTPEQLGDLVLSTLNQ
jgi:protein SCO1